MEANIEPCLRMRSPSEISCPFRYQTVQKLIPGGPFVDSNGNQVPVGSNVRLVSWMDRTVDSAGMLVSNGPNICANVQADTQLSLYQTITITGVSTAPDSDGDGVLADGIYLGGIGAGADDVGLGMQVGQPFQYGAISGQLADSIGAYSVDSVGTDDSPPDNSDYDAPGAIGWALSQPDGTLISLLGEGIESQSEDGCILGIREWFGLPFYPPPLFVVLNNGAQPMVGATIDIENATLVTLANGQRALDEPAGGVCLRRPGRQLRSAPADERHYLLRQQGADRAIRLRETTS